MTTISQPVLAYDRKKDVKEFEETKLGVKGLIDSGITQIPSIFHHPEENLVDTAANSESNLGLDPIPVIDLSGPKEAVVDEIREAAGKFGFFQVINHGISVSLIDGVVERVKEFHELPAEERMKYYRRDMETGVNYFSNVDLFVSKAASWRDTLQLRLGPRPQLWLNLMLFLMFVGLGVKEDKLKELSCGEGRVMVGHYYPYCPEPNKTIGIASHTDPGILTVLLQDQVGGLQVKYNGKWVNVKPVHGALVINVGDLLQMISNDKYKSVEHRVYANPLHEPRISIAIFFNPSRREDLYGPLPEIVSPEQPALYQHFTYNEFMYRFFSKELDGKSLIKFFSLENKS